MEENIDSSINYICDEEINLRVLTKLNKKFGKDLQNLSKAKSYVEELQSKQKELEQRLLFATSETPDRISRAVVTAEQCLMEKDELVKRLQLLDSEIKILKYQEELETVLEGITPSINLLEEVERVKAYQKWISCIEELSSQIELNLKLEHVDQALMHYEKLKESADVITASKCLHLKEYTCHVVLHWHNILSIRLEEEFHTLLKSLKWPFIMSSTSLKPPPPSQELMQKLESLVLHLLQLDVSDAVRSGVQDPKQWKKIEEDEEEEEKLSPSFLANFKVSSVPIRLFLKPLEVRFFYHFNGEKATNSRKNPEWYLTQVLKWVSIHESFIDTYIQPVLSRSNHPKVNAKVDFIKGLLRLVVVKLYSDFPEMNENEDLFCQTVQETLNFERELRLGLGYPSSQPTVLSVLTQGYVFTNWIFIEKKFALELMDEFVASPNSWYSEEDGGICQCGEQLIILLQGITDRYKPLSQPGHRLQFLNLQLELLDDFRVRLLQLMKSELSDPLNSNYIAILNTVHHMVATISDWCDLPFFIEIQYFREKFLAVESKMKTDLNDLTLQISSEELDFSENLSNVLSPCDSLSFDQEFKISDSAFSAIISLYTRIELEMLSVVNEHVLTEVRARSQSYRREKWFVTPSMKSVVLPEVSPSLCPLLEALVKHLLLLREKLAPELFSKLWKELASALNKFIYEEVIMQNNFSEFGAAQLNHDMVKALFPVFGEFSSKPENYFPLIKESVILLTLPRATALLLKDTLHASNREFYSQNTSPVKALEERGVFHLGVDDARTILNIRTNMATS